MSKMPEPTPEELAYLEELRALLARMPSNLMVEVRPTDRFRCGALGDLALMKFAPGGAVGIGYPITVRCA